MREVKLKIEDFLYDFYRRIGQQAGGLPPEKVMSDALFKLAGELSLNALHKTSCAVLRTTIMSKSQSA